MTTFTSSDSDSTLTENKGDSCDITAGTGDGVISRALRAVGACGQSAGHVTFDPCGLSHCNLRLSHFSHNFPAFHLRSAEDKTENPQLFEERITDFPPGLQQPSEKQSNEVKTAPLLKSDVRYTRSRTDDDLLLERYRDHIVDEALKISQEATGDFPSSSLPTRSTPVRRNTVSVIRVKPRRVNSLSSHGGATSERTSTISKRRPSFKSPFDKFLSDSSRTKSPESDDIASALEFFSWPHLLAAFPRSELEAAITERTKIPLYSLTKSRKTNTMTSVGTIEQSLTPSYPDIQVMLSAPCPKVLLPAEPFSPAVSYSLSSLDETDDQLSSLIDVNLSDFEKPNSPMSASILDEVNVELTDDLPFSGRVGTLRWQQRNGQDTDAEPKESAAQRFQRVSINTCIRTMREGTGNYSSQLTGCEDVGSYADQDTLKVVLAKSDAISCVISAMKAFMEEEELQKQACASLLKMASISAANCVYISKHDGVAVIAGTMRRYENNLEVTKLVLRTLGYLSTVEEVRPELLRHYCHSDVLAAMSRHSDDRTIISQASFVLGNLVISVEVAQQLMLVGGVHTIIAMLRRYRDDKDILESGCRALGSFALYDETCLDVAEAGATQIVLEAMKSPHSDVNVKECCCWTLACLTAEDSTCQELVSLGGLHVLLTTLEMFPQEELLQEYGVRCLCNIGSLESTLVDVSSPRVMNISFAMHRNFPDNVELIELMMLALSQVAAVNTEVQKLLLSREGLKQLTAIMRSLEENPAVQESGCRILGNIAVNASLRKSMEQQGVSQVIISAMLNNELSSEVQLSACMALGNLTADLVDNKIRVMNNGAVPILLMTLRTFSDNPEVVLSALKALGNLVDLGEACRQLLDDNGLATIIQFAKDQTASSDIRSSAAQVLSGFTALPDLPIEDLLKVEKTLVTLQAALPRDPDLALSMCQGLYNLIKSEAGLDTFIEKGWVGVIQNMMTVFRTNPDIHLTIFRTVAKISMESRRRLSEASCPLTRDTLKSVLLSLRQLLDHKEVQMVGMATLSCVCDSFESLRVAIAEEGGLRDVTSAMTTFPAEDRLHSVGLIAMSYLLPAGTDLKDNDKDLIVAMDVISKSMSHFVENEEIQISGCKALERCELKDVGTITTALTCVYNSLRRHGGLNKVQKAAKQVFKRFEVEDLTDQMLESRSTHPSELIDKALQKKVSHPPENVGSEWIRFLM